MKDQKQATRVIQINDINRKSIEKRMEETKMRCQKAREMIDRNSAKRGWIAK